MDQSENPKTLLIRIAKLLDELGISYVITGGMAVIMWGQPRYTADIDVLIQLKEAHVPIILSALTRFSEFGYIDEQMIRDAVVNHGEFNYIDTDAGFKVDFWVPKDSPFVQSCFARRKKESIGGYAVWFLSPEDLILSKLEWIKRGSLKSQYDVRAVMAGQEGKLDWKYIESWAQRLGVEEELRMAKAFKGF